MTVLESFYAQAGLTIALRPPRSGIYYSSIAVNNPLPYTFAVQNGSNQNTLAAGSAQLYAVPSSGSPLILYPPQNSLVYGAYIGPLQAVWFESDEAPGSYPSPLALPSGIVQWAPPSTHIGGIGTAQAFYFAVPGLQLGQLLSVTVANVSYDLGSPEQISLVGVQSGEQLGNVTGIQPGKTGIIPVTVTGTDDTEFYLTPASGEFHATISLGLA